MPGLVICGRRSSIISGDDLDWLCFLTIGMRVVEIILLIPALTLTVEDLFDEVQVSPQKIAVCLPKRKTRVGGVPVGFLSVSIFGALVSISIDIAIWFISGRGSPTQPEERKPVAPLFAFQLLVIPFLLLGLAIGGLVGLGYFSSIQECLGFSPRNTVWMKTFTAAVCFQFIEAIVYLLILLYRMNDELRRRAHRRSKQASSRDLSGEAEKWEKCCMCCCKVTALCCCFSFGGRGIQHEDFGSMSKALASLFQGWTLDITPSDIRMAMHMLGLLQSQRKQDTVRQLKIELEDTNIDTPVDRQVENGIFNEAFVAKALNFIKMSRSDESGVCGSDSCEDDVFDEEANNSEQAINIRRSQLVYKAIEDSTGVHYEFEARNLVSPEYEGDRYIIAEGAHFIVYSEAINTWKNYVFGHLATSACELACASCSLALNCHGKPSEYANEPITVGDNICRLHEAALLKVVGFDQSKVELSYAYFNKYNRVEEAVYCILIDHQWRSIVVCVRGSLSLGDYVVNLDIEPESLEGIGVEYGFDGNDQFCHRGYFARATWILEDMKRHKILDSLRGKYKNYSLRITGHSLGAGTAAPLALMMRNKFPDLSCLCYGPPGGLFSLETARRCEDFVTTFVVNSDLVPRISASTMRLLRDEVLDLIARIKVPKREVLKLRLSNKTLEDLPEGLGVLLHEEDNIPESDFTLALEKFKEQLRHQKEIDSSPRISMHIPGKVVHLLKTSERDRYREMLQGFFPLSNVFNWLTCNQYLPREAFTPKWASIEDFNEIIVSKTLVSDHMVEYVRDALHGVAAQFGIDPAFPP